MLKENKKIIAVEKPEGDGAVVKRLFPTVYHNHFDPFVLIDEFFVEAPNEFAPHEHSGFEAISYMLGGAFRHEDNQGNEEEVAQGGLQTFNAGKGIVHSEAPGTAGYAHGMQIWVNLPADMKDSDPEYQALKPENVPVKESDRMKIRSLIGPGSPIKLKTELILQDITLESGGIYNLQLAKEMQGFIYVVDGIIEADTKLNEGEALLLIPETSIEVRTVSDESRFIFAAGKPHGNDIKIRGSHVL
ncbi:MAG: pirin family protein [Bacillota bacterium]